MSQARNASFKVVRSDCARSRARSMVSAGALNVTFFRVATNPVYLLLFRQELLCFAQEDIQLVVVQPVTGLIYFHDAAVGDLRRQRI